jgi:hypothetical protein
MIELPEYLNELKKTKRLSGEEVLKIVELIKCHTTKMICLKIDRMISDGLLKKINKEKYAGLRKPKSPEWKKAISEGMKAGAQIKAKGEIDE